MHTQCTQLTVSFANLKCPTFTARQTSGILFEFHVAKSVREAYGLDQALFSSSGNVIFADFYAARVFAAKLNERINPAVHPEHVIKAGKINAMALVDEIFHAICNQYRQHKDPDAFAKVHATIAGALGTATFNRLLETFIDAFPPATNYAGNPGTWLQASTAGTPNTLIALEELFMLRLANENPAFEPFKFLFDDSTLRQDGTLIKAMQALDAAFAGMPVFGPDDQTLPNMLRAPIEASPYSIAGQLDFMRRRWGMVIGQRMRKLLGGVDMLAEEEKPFFPGPGPVRVLSYEHMDHEYERFSTDRDWMPKVVMIAKSTLVWLDQLSKAYNSSIRTLDAIPDEELDRLASCGFNALWLIGLWERSAASRRIKELCGNPEAAASAYSLFDYEIASELGGWPALENLRRRAEWRGLRLAADMVPNHTGLDSAWMRDRPELFIQRDKPPFPNYSFSGENLSGDGRIGLWLEDHYYTRQDAAVVFKRVDFTTGKTTYIYHGNDGTNMPWNDTAQIDFINPDARAAVKERILHVAKNFPIIRFDAAMILAKRHFRRLWYPEPGHGGDIASRGEDALGHDDFEARIPEEFWREVVDMCAAETPDTLLLAEAFWMMEGYFVRTLGMHRVYNSAFMNMLKNKENRKYRETIRNTQEFDKDILKRFVNFMNNPDEETAAVQFGRDDHYFGICTMMATMPGLPMFGHGQIEGLTEKYGMEYRRAYRDESPDSNLVQRHIHEIFPLLKRRYLFSEVDHFLLYDLVRHDGMIDDNVFAYSNGQGEERALVLFNNAWEQTAGTITLSCPFADKQADGSRPLTRKTIFEGLGLTTGSGRYAIMREQRSGLWYIRSANDIQDKGLFVMLGGFQCQVFLDIGTVQDDGLGNWTELYKRLGGQGVADLSAARQDIALEELYAAWNRIWGSSWFRHILDRDHIGEQPVIAGRRTPRLQAATLNQTADHALDDQPEASRCFARTARQYMAEVSGINMSPDSGTTTENRMIHAISALKAAMAKVGPPIGKQPATPPRKASPKDKPLAMLVDRLQAVPGSLEATAAFAAMTSIAALAGQLSPGQDARAIIDHWCLDRKIREAMQAAHVHGDTAWQAISIAKALMASIDDLSAGLSIEQAVARIPDNEEWSRLLGLNLWDGITWMNAEAFQRIATTAATAAVLWLTVLQSGAKPATKAIVEMLDHHLSIAQAVGWNFDRFHTAIAEDAAQTGSGQKAAHKTRKPRTRTPSPLASSSPSHDSQEKPS
jgi:glycosidase